ncbi:MAG: NADH-quinone oxidoreductase subunit NuoE [Spirochaetes bacterium]|nr:NADH-quinone oxidoreductase subunit NuoE [Spirochaetota bacterium]
MELEKACCKKIIKKILKKYNENYIENILPILQEIKDHFGYISMDFIKIISENTSIPETEIIGVASFYSSFKFNKSGKYNIKICHGTACHVNGAEQIKDAIIEILKINTGETTNDGLFSIEEVACLGCCSLAPVIMINEKVFGKLEPQKIKKIIDELKNK